jgi:hypothetical protein
MPKNSPSLALAVLACLAACSGDGNRSRLRVGDEGDGRADAGGTSGTGNGGFGMQPSGGQGGVSGTGVSQNPLSVRVEDLEEMAIEIVTLSCAGECAEVRAVARGGNPPYSFAWNDGSTDAERELCPDATTSFDVTATDTPIVADEFNYEGASKTARVTANVVDCSDDGGMPDAMIPPQGSCIDLEDAPHWDVCPPSPELRDPSTGVEAGPCPSGGSSNRVYARLASYDGAPIEQESLGGVLCSPLRANIATSIHYAIGLGGVGSQDPFTEAGVDTTFEIELWGGSSPCDKGELLWSSSPLPRMGWSCPSVTPTRDHTHIQVVIRIQRPPWATFQHTCATVQLREPTAADCAM